MAATIKQIAKEAGVSCGTVDRALHDRPGVNPEVAARILAIAKKYEYRPNTLAKALANSAKTYKIAVLVHAKGNEFYREVLLGMEAAANSYKDSKIALQMHSLKGYDPADMRQVLEPLTRRTLAGLILTPIADPEIDAALSRIQQRGTQIVTLNADTAKENRFCYVGCDDRQSGMTAAALFGMMFSSTQKASITIVTGSMKQSGHCERVNGFLEAAKRDYPQLSVDKILENNDDNLLCAKLIEQFYQNNCIPDGIYFCAGGIAGGLSEISAHTEHPFPRIITVDETDAVKEALQSGLVAATVTQSPYEQGYKAVKVICDKLLYGNEPEQNPIMMQGEVKLRYHIKPNQEE